MDRLVHAALDSVYALGSCFCSPAATVKLNGRTFKIVKLLGEGGFSYVYLAQDPSSGRLFALKKIRCPLGSDSVKEALREVEAYRRFRHPNIIRCLDSCVVQDKEGDGKIIYLFLPYYSRGNLQDAINSHALNGTQFNERDMLNLFLGTCYAVRAMHHYRPGATTTYPPTNDASTVEFDVGLEEGGSESTATLVPNGKRPGTGGRGKHRPLAQHDHSDDEEDSDEEAEHHGLRDAKGQERPLMGTIGSLANAVASEEGSSVPGLAGSSSAPITAVLDPQPPPSASGSGAGGEGKGKAQPWAHRDLKPANVMIADDGTPILMDFGSAIPGRVEIPNRSVALAQQDLAAEHSSMPYRAPELFDVKTSSTLTESTDIWSLGCVLFSLAYLYSPFETPSTVEQGGSMALAVMNGGWKFPEGNAARGYSEGLRDIVRACLKVKPEERADIDGVIELTENALQRLA